jgi:hypothetical protein
MQQRRKRCRETRRSLIVPQECGNARNLNQVAVGSRNEPGQYVRRRTGTGLLGRRLPTPPAVARQRVWFYPSVVHVLKRILIYSGVRDGAACTFVKVPGRSRCIGFPGPATGTSEVWTEPEPGDLSG